MSVSVHDSGVPGRLADAIPPEQRPGAHRCTNAECEYGGKWLVGTMARTKNVTDGAPSR